MTAVVAPPPPPFDSSLRVRLAPAPSGDLHVGNVRTGLYNWLLARRHGGTFILRVEDTDRSRVSDQAFKAAQDVLRWMGLDWDEGPGVGGPHAPYRQSERLALYADAAGRLLAEGAAYRCWCTPEELRQRNEAARAAGRPPGYDGRCRELTREQVSAFEAEGRTHVLRFRMPAGSTTWEDLVRGEVTIEHDNVPDFTLTRSDGHPLYLLAAAVDDVAMGLTHIIRGEDLTTATPRQLAVYAALGHPRERWPGFGHLPLITGEDGKPLSKRNGEVSIAWYRRHGFLPEAMVNYLALLGWSLDASTELFDVATLVESFDVRRVSRNPARFDLRKLEAINGEKIRALPADELCARVNRALVADGVLPDPPAPEQANLVRAALPVARERMSRLTQAGELLGFLFAEDPLAFEAEAAAKGLTVENEAALVAVREAYAALPEWAAVPLMTATWATLVDGLGLSKRKAQLPVRVAVTGRQHGLPLFESLELLGRERTLARLDAAAARARGG